MKKLLVCAPSNAAVDELVMRFKDGLKSRKGVMRKPVIVRLGKSDAINASVADVTLDRLVTDKLNASKESNGNKPSEFQQVLDQRRATAKQLDDLSTKFDEMEKNGLQKSVDDRRQWDMLKRQKAQLGTRLDQLSDKDKTSARDVDINRRLIQQQILDGAEIICATLSGSGHDMMQNLNIEFETVIIDEAAQSIELSALIPLKYGCSKCILVGDPKQLPPTVMSKEAKSFQMEQSLFVRMQTNHPSNVHLLDTQYRMHPEISLFPSKAFYDAKLLDGKGMAESRYRDWHASTILGPYRFFDVQGQHQAAPQGHSLVNLAEIKMAILLIKRLFIDFPKVDYKDKIGIITPYKSQLRELKLKFEQEFGSSIEDKIEFNTTDAYQGREREIILFSCVRASASGGIGFLDDIRRMNVGMTRAKSSMWVLGNSESLMRGKFWAELVGDAKLRNRYSSGNLPSLLAKPARVLAPINTSLDPDGDVEMKDVSETASSGQKDFIKLSPSSETSTSAISRHESTTLDSHSHLSGPSHTMPITDPVRQVQSSSGQSRRPSTEGPKPAPKTVDMKDLSSVGSRKRGPPTPDDLFNPLSKKVNVSNLSTALSESSNAVSPTQPHAPEPLQGPSNTKKESKSFDGKESGMGKPPSVPRVHNRPPPRPRKPEADAMFTKPKRRRP
jgi:senataxin